MRVKFHMDRFAERMKSSLLAIAHPLTLADRQAEPPLADAEARVGVKLPADLRQYDFLAGKLDRFNRAHNERRRLEDLSVDGGKLTFLTEHDGVVLWRVEASTTPSDDATVYQAENVRGRPGSWYVEHERRSEFLLIMLRRQALWGRLEFLGGTDITSSASSRFLAHRPGAAACVMKNTDSSQLYVGGGTLQDFALIERDLESLDVKLDHF
jgi:hypothetical protein